MLKRPVRFGLASLLDHDADAVDGFIGHTASLGSPASTKCAGWRRFVRATI